MAAEASLLSSYFRRMGWLLAKAILFVEGDQDVGYFEIASTLYEQKNAKRLIGNDLAVISAGSGDDGGATAVSDRISFCHVAYASDRKQGYSIKHRIVGMFDNDAAGRKAKDEFLRYRRDYL